jgi:hypothetical protein
MSTEDRLPERVAIGLLTKVFPPDLVDDVVDRTGARHQRERDLPARLTVYFTLALWLFLRSGYEYVMTCVIDGLVWARWSPAVRRVPRASSLARARDRLGPDVLHRLFESVAGPVGTPETQGAFWRDRRVLSLDGTTLGVPDTPDNNHAWGQPNDETGLARLPQVRVLALAECGTHAVIDATFGPYAIENRHLLQRLLHRLEPGTVLLADLGPVDQTVWTQAAATGADLVWRVPSDPLLPVRHRLVDGTYLSHLVPGSAPTERPPVRVINYRIAEEGEPISLITTLTDPEQAPWIELAMLYPQRWRLSVLTASFETGRRGAELTLRSRTAHGIAQEIWAMFCVHGAIRDLVSRPSATAVIGPERIRFTSA